MTDTNLRENTIYNCIIIGAGASGLFFAASPDSSCGGLILDSSKRPGLKLLMSGSGQCNITHSGSIKDFVKYYNTGKIRSCLFKYNNQSLRNFLSENGVNTIARADGKVFPASMKAQDILNILLRLCDKNGFEMRTNHKVTGIKSAADGLWQVISKDQNFRCKRLIIATGGCSYPTTGSDGSMFEILRRDLGLDITELRPALSPIRVLNYPYSSLSGISFDEAEIKIFDGSLGTLRVKATGPLLLTHSDFSGPVVLNISKEARTGDILEINYLGQDVATVRAKLQAARQGSAKNMASDVAQITNLPLRFCKSLEERYGRSISKISGALCGERFNITSGPGYKKAMATAGGVSLDAIDTKTFECKSYKNLYIIGEACDVDGITGGYNLQFAFSSAFAAAAKVHLTED